MPAMGDNPFLAYLKTHPRADAQALKELYRILAKRTHPDTGSTDGARFVALQEAYHEALASLIERHTSNASPALHEPANSDHGLRTLSNREQVLQALYRYLACVPSKQIDVKPVHARCRTLFTLGVTKAGEYSTDAARALEAFDEQFHEQRAVTARFPDVRTKYLCLMDGLRSFFDYQTFGNDLMVRVAHSYLQEIHPVRDFDPSGDPRLRTNRSAAARAALYAMRQWIESELQKPRARLL